MSDLAAIITAVTGLLAVLGTAARFLWVRLETRFTSIEDAQRKCEMHRGVQLTVIELLWAEMLRLGLGEAPILARCGKLLDKLKED